jgi:hypothetical protein
MGNQSPAFCKVVVASVVISVPLVVTADNRPARRRVK